MGDLIQRLIGRKKVTDPALRFDQPVAAMPAIWFCPPPASEAWPELFSEPAISALAQHARALELYHLHLIPDSAHVTHWPNTWGRLRDLDALNLLHAHGLQLAIETGAHKPHLTTPEGITSPPPEHFVAGVSFAINRARELCADIQIVLDVDEPLSSGLHLCKPAWTEDAILAHMQAYCAGVWAAYPGLPIIVAEPYPSISIPAMLRQADALPGIAGLDVDVDLNAVRGQRAAFTRDMQIVRDGCRVRGLTLGVIVWGFDERSDATWVQSAERLLAWFGEAFGTDWPDVISVQSWSPDGDRPRRMPRTLGEAPSLWSVMRTTRRVLEGQG